MAFFDHIKKQAEELSSNNYNNEEVVYPSVNAPINYLSAKTPQYVFRLLPSAGLLNGTSEDFATSIRQVYFNNPVPNAKPKTVNLRLAPEKDVNSPIEQALVRWADAKLLPSGYGDGQVRPQEQFMFYIIPYIPNGAGGYTPELGQDGLPSVQVLQVSKSAYQGIVNKLANDLYNPVLPSTGQPSPISFLSLERSWLVTLEKAKAGETQHKVDVYSNIDLGSVEGLVEHKLEDLSVLQYTTEDINPGLVEHIIKTIDEGTGSAPAQGAPQTPNYAPQGNSALSYEQMQQQTPQAPPVQQQQQAPQMPTQQQVPPVQQQAPQAPQVPNQQQAPQVPNQQQQQVPPVQQVPQAPQAPVQQPQAPQAPPAQPQAPQAPQVPNQQQAPAQPQAPQVPNSPDTDSLTQSLRDSLLGG